jgi:hypothetical protein
MTGEMSDTPEPLKRAIERAEAAAETLPDRLPALGLREPGNFSEWLGTAVALAGRAFGSNGPDALADYCGSLLSCRHTLILEKLLNREFVEHQRWRRVTSAWKAATDPRDAPRLSMQRLGGAVQVWGDGAREDDEKALFTLVSNLALAEGATLALLARQISDA